MRWPWSSLDFSSGARELGLVQIHSRFREDFRHVKSDIFELGDWPLYALKRSDSDRMWSELPGLPRDYEADFFDCENETRRRMVQVIDYLADWTNLRKPPAIYEIRGHVQAGGGRAGHSMIYEMYADGSSTLREPRSLLAKPLSYMEGPWLIYE